MRIGALSTATGVSVATLKWYLRDGLLHPGRPTAVNQATYDLTHVRRVKLIRALVELGHLGIAEVREVLSAVDDDAVGLHTALGAAHDAMMPKVSRDHPLFPAAMAAVDGFVRRHGIDVRADAPVRAVLAQTLVWMTEFGWSEPGTLVDVAIFDTLVPGLMEQASAEIAFIPDGSVTDRAGQVEYSVVGTMVFEQAASAIRRMAHEHASAKRFGTRG